LINLKKRLIHPEITTSPKDKIFLRCPVVLVVAALRHVDLMVW
jgi:hypothetical protein